MFAGQRANTGGKFLATPQLPRKLTQELPKASGSAEWFRVTYEVIPIILMNIFLLSGSGLYSCGVLSAL